MTSAVMRVPRRYWVVAGIFALFLCTSMALFWSVETVAWSREILAGNTWSGTGGGGHAAPRGTPSESHRPSVQETVHKARPMTADELLEARIKNKNDHARASKRPFQQPSAVPEAALPHPAAVEPLVPETDAICWHTVTSPRLYADNHGRVCTAIDENGCCAEDTLPACDGCTDAAARDEAVPEDDDARTCCEKAEHCVACCMSRLGRGPPDFLPCKAACRTSSASLEHRGSREYTSALEHCFVARTMSRFQDARRLLAHYIDWALPHRPLIEYEEPSASPAPVDSPRVMQLRVG